MEIVSWKNIIINVKKTNVKYKPEGPENGIP